MDTQDKETLGHRIARLRVSHGMTQERLAREMSVTPQSVSKWENDVCAPDISGLPRLSRLLGTSIDELLCGSGGTDGPSGEKCAAATAADAGAGSATGAGTGASAASLPGRSLAATDGATGEGDAAAGDAAQAPQAAPRLATHVRIQLHDADDGDGLNLRVPLGVARWAITSKVGALACGRRALEGINLEGISAALGCAEPGVLIDLQDESGSSVVISLE